MHRGRCDNRKKNETTVKSFSRKVSIRLSIQLFYIVVAPKKQAATTAAMTLLNDNGLIKWFYEHALHQVLLALARCRCIIVWWSTFTFILCTLHSFLSAVAFIKCKTLSNALFLSRHIAISASLSRSLALSLPLSLSFFLSHWNRFTTFIHFLLLFDLLRKSCVVWCEFFAFNSDVGNNKAHAHRETGTKRC